MTTTLFKEVGYSLSKLMTSRWERSVCRTSSGPFVWKNAKVRDLFDSMYRGYPVGYFLFWENQVGDKTKLIGVNSHQKTPQAS